MQDRDFDEIFRSKLENFETQPSAGLWPAIDAQMAGHKQKRVWLPILGAAASLIVLVAAGTLFFPGKPYKNKQISSLAGRPAMLKAKPALQNSPTRKYPGMPALTPQTIPGKGTTVMIAGNQPQKMRPVHNTADISENPIMEDNAKPEKYAKGSGEQPLMGSLTSRSEAITDIAPGNDSPPAKLRPEELSHQVIKPTFLTAHLPAPADNHLATAKMRHKIRTIGDLVNAVVAKVDKRTDKVIEFSNTDEDESSITGVNLGIIKIKKNEQY